MPKLEQREYLENIPNINKVNKRQWKKWSGRQQKLFNDLYDHVLNNQELYQHPRGIRQNKEHWKTTAWNVAWMAASFSWS